MTRCCCTAFQLNLFVDFPAMITSIGNSSPGFQELYNMISPMSSSRGADMMASQPGQRYMHSGLSSYRDNSAIDENTTILGMLR